MWNGWRNEVLSTSKRFRRQFTFSCRPRENISASDSSGSSRPFSKWSSLYPRSATAIPPGYICVFRQFLNIETSEFEPHLNGRVPRRLLQAQCVLLPLLTVQLREIFAKTTSGQTVWAPGRYNQYHPGWHSSWKRLEQCFRGSAFLTISEQQSEFS